MRNEQPIETDRDLRLRPFRILRHIIRAAKIDVLMVGYLLFILVCAVLLQVIEPQTFSSFEPTLWYLFQTVITVGFGDIIAKSVLGHVITVIVGLSSLAIVGLVSGIAVNFYIEVTRWRRKDSLALFDERMQHLCELSPEDLKKLQADYHAFRSH